MKKKKQKIKLGYDFVIRVLLTALIVSCFCFMYFCELEVLSWIGHKSYANTLKDEFKICFFDVGQGDCTFVKYRDITILIDAGPEENNNLCKNINDLNLGEDIDYFILTHADTDHVGGAKEIFDCFNIKKFYRPKTLSLSEYKKDGNPDNYGVHSTEAYDSAISAGYVEESCKMQYVNAGEIVRINNFSLEILYPAADNDIKVDDTNSNSAVVRVVYGDDKYLLMADASSEIEKKLIDVYGTSLNCDVLRIAHHGSNYATTEEFLTITSPTYAIASVGKTGIDDYGHLGEKIKSRIEKSGAYLYSTYSNGHIIFDSDLNIFEYLSLPSLSYALISVVCGVLILLVWGLKLFKREKKQRIRIEI